MANGKLDDRQVEDAELREQAQTLAMDGAAGLIDALRRDMQSSFRNRPIILEDVLERVDFLNKRFEGDLGSLFKRKDIPSFEVVHQKMSEAVDASVGMGGRVAKLYNHGAKEGLRRFHNSVRPQYPIIEKNQPAAASATPAIQRQAQGFTKAELQEQMQRAVQAMEEPLARIRDSIVSDKKLAEKVQRARAIYEDVLGDLIDHRCPDIVRSDEDFGPTSRALENQLANAAKFMKPTNNPHGLCTQVFGIMRGVKSWIADRLSVPDGPVATGQEPTEELDEEEIDTDLEDEEPVTNTPPTPEPTISAHTLSALLSDMGIEAENHINVIYKKCITLASLYYWSFLEEMTDHAPFNTDDDVSDNILNAIHVLFLHVQEGLHEATHASKELDFDTLSARIQQALLPEKLQAPFLDANTIQTFSHVVLAPLQKVFAGFKDADSFVEWILETPDPTDDYSKLEQVTSILLAKKPKKTVVVVLDDREKDWLTKKLPLARAETLVRMRKNRPQMKAWAKFMQEEIGDSKLPVRPIEFMQNLLDDIVKKYQEEHPPVVVVPAVTPEEPKPEIIDIPSLLEAEPVTIDAGLVAASPVMEISEDPLQKAPLVPVSPLVDVPELQTTPNAKEQEPDTEEISSEEKVPETPTPAFPEHKVKGISIIIIKHELKRFGITSLDELKEGQRAEALETVRGRIYGEGPHPPRPDTYFSELFAEAFQHLRAENAPPAVATPAFNFPIEGDISAEQAIIRKMIASSVSITDALAASILTALNIRRTKERKEKRSKEWLYAVITRMSTKPWQTPVVLGESAKEAEPQEPLDPLEQLIRSLEDPATIAEALRSRANLLTIQSTVAALSANFEIDQNVVNDFMMPALEFHFVLSRIGSIPPRIDRPVAWLIGGVKNEVYSRRFPSDYEGGSMIKRAVEWLVNERMADRRVSLQAYLDFRNSHAPVPFPVAKTIAPQPQLEKQLPTEAVMAETQPEPEISDIAQDTPEPQLQPEPILEDPFVSVTVHSDHQHFTFTQTAQTDVSVPSVSSLEDLLGLAEQPVSMPTEDQELAQNLVQWWKAKFLPRMQQIMNTPTQVEQAVEALLADITTWEEEFNTVVLDIEENVDAESNAVRFVQMAHLFSKSDASERTESHISLDQFEPAIEKLQEHSARTKVLETYRKKLQAVEKSINEQRALTNSGKAALNIIRSKDVELPLHLLGDMPVQIIAPTSMAEALERLRELQVMFERTWNDHISIRTGAHPADLPEGSIDDLFQYALDAYSVFRGEAVKKPKATAKATKEKRAAKREAVVAALDSFPALTSLQERCMQLLTAQTSGDNDMRRYTWGHSATKLAAYWALAFPDEPVPTVEEIEAALEQVEICKIDDEDRKQPNGDMRREQKMVVLWEKQQGRRGKLRLYMATHLAFDWAKVEKKELTGDALKVVSKKREEDRETNAQIKKARLEQKERSAKKKKKEPEIEEEVI